MTVRIFQPCRTTTQSGVGKTQNWLLEFEPATPRQPEALMGWTSAGDTLNQIRLRFDTREEAVAYAERKGLAYAVQEPAIRRVRPRSYVDRFRPGRPN
jgi:hypothetical protein